MLKCLLQVPRPCRRQFTDQRRLQFLPRPPPYPTATAQQRPAHVLESLRRGLALGPQPGVISLFSSGVAKSTRVLSPRRTWSTAWFKCVVMWKRDYDEVKRDAQAIYGANGRRQAEAAFRSFRRRWQRPYGAMVRQLERDLPELLSFFAFPRHLWKKLRTSNIIERCFVEVRRRTRPMVCFVNVKSVDRIIYSASSSTSKYKMHKE
jgi:putative transposase